MAKHMAYHYMNASTFGNIEIGRFGPANVLEPRRKLDSGLLGDMAPECAKRNYLFCFLDDPKPKAWVNAPKGMWMRIMGKVLGPDISGKILGFEVLPEDEAFVVDYAHMDAVSEEMRRLGTHIHIGRMDKRLIYEALTKYISTRVSLAEYQGDYTLPELIIANEVPLERITETSEMDI